MKKFRYIVGIIGALVLMASTGCVEKFEADISDLMTEGLVVEGNIISDSTVVFNLSKTIPLNFSEDNKDAFENYQDVYAELAVVGSDGSSYPGLWWGRGRYRVEIGTLKPDVAYHLEILYNGDTYQSEPQKPLACRGIKELTFRQPDLSGPVSVHLTSQPSDSGDSEYYLWYFEEDWEVRAHFQTTYLYDAELNGLIEYPYPPVAQGWCYNGTDQILLGSTESVTGNQIVGRTIQSIKPTDHRLSVLYSIRVQQRNLSRMEYEYYQVRAKLNNEMGGLFTPQPSELPTNITCSNPTRKVIGYVGCNMGVAHAQLYIPEEEVVYIDSYSCDIGKDPAGSYLDKYAAGFQVSDKTEQSVEWAKIGCVDVRSWQANPTGRPSWWPNPYLYYKEEPDYGGI